MEKCFDEKKIAKLTGTAVQDDETFKAVSYTHLTLPTIA